MQIGEKLAMLRKSRRLTLQQVSQVTGISVSHLSAIENGTRKSPSFQYIERLAHLYQVPISFFADGATAEEAELDGTDVAVDETLDAGLREFVTRESSAPYLALAKRLAEHDALSDNADALLRLIADFLKDYRQSRSYPSGK